MIYSTRPSWNEYFIEVAFSASKRATCNRRHVGAIVVIKNQIIATGFNGSPKGLVHCIDVGCLMVDSHCVRCLHAEENAIIQSQRDLTGASIYCTDKPCFDCTKRIINAGITHVYYVRDYSSELADQFITEANIKIERLEYNESGNNHNQ